MGLTEFIVHWITNFIDQIGYLGLTILMALESMIAPVPSEAVMPFAGFLWFENRFSFFGIAIFSTFGSLIGSLISYYLGAFGGRPIIRKYGRYFLLNEHHLQVTEKFFRKYGDKTIFFSRFIPIIRHLISIPAGIGKMKLIKFTVYTGLGAFLWNSFLAYLGYHLGHNWVLIKKFGEIIDIVLIFVILGLIIFFLYKRLKPRTNYQNR